MTDDKRSSPQWQQLLENVRETHPDVVVGAMFGMPCAKLAGKAFMGAYGRGVVFKLSSPQHERALALAGSQLFDPSGRRPMREWVVVPSDHEALWLVFAEAALAKVGS